MAASDSIRPRSGHLSGRVAAPTRVGEAGGSRNLTGAPPPHKRFSLGLHPVSLGKTKEMGWNRQHNLKITASKTASSINLRPGGGGTPPLQKTKLRVPPNPKPPLQPHTQKTAARKTRAAVRIHIAYFLISSPTVSGSAVIVMVNLMPSLSAKLESQSRKSTTCASVPALNILWKLSMKMCEMS